MKRLIPIAAVLITLAGCRTEDALRVYGGPDSLWLLKQLDGAAFPATATLSFPKAGEIAGQAPCNRYFGGLEGAYPAFAAGPIGSTRMACPDSSAETAFLRALDSVTTADVTDDTLTLSGPDDTEMVFTRSE